MASTNTTNLMLNGLGLDTQQFSEMFKGGLDKLTGENEDGTEKSEIGEDPEVIAARLEQEERRKEKHRKMEEEREKMRQNIRAKYNIKKKEQQIPGNQFVEGRIGGPKKVPEQVEQTAENSLLWQLGLAESLGKAKTAVTGAIVIVKGYLPFGPFTK